MLRVRTVGLFLAKGFPLGSCCGSLVGSGGLCSMAPIGHMVYRFRLGMHAKGPMVWISLDCRPYVNKPMSEAHVFTGAGRQRAPVNSQPSPMSVAPTTPTPLKLAGAHDASFWSGPILISERLMAMQHAKPMITVLPAEPETMSL